MVITNMFRDRVTVRTVCELMAARMHCTDLRWFDVVLYWDAEDGAGPQPLDYDSRLCDVIASDARNNAEYIQHSRNRGSFCLYGPAHPRAVNQTEISEPQHIDYYTHVRTNAPSGRTYPVHALNHLVEDQERPPVPILTPYRQPRHQRQRQPSVQRPRSPVRINTGYAQPNRVPIGALPAPIGAPASSRGISAPRRPRPVVPGYPSGDGAPT